MKRFKRFVGIFLYVLFIGFATGLGEYYGIHLKKIAAAGFNFYPVFIFSILFPIIIGILLGLSKFINELKKEGTWKWDWVKFLAAGLPTLYISSFYILAYFQISPYLYPSKLIYIISGSEFIFNLSAMAFGYLFLTTLYKDTNYPED